MTTPLPPDPEEMNVFAKRTGLDGDDSGELSPFSSASQETPLEEALAALDKLLSVTIDAVLCSGMPLSEDEFDARGKALAVFEKYGPKTSTPALS